MRAILQDMARIIITYDGEPALTIPQAAVRYGLALVSMRSALRHLDVQALPEPLDGRTPLYLVVELDRAMNARPGKGANLRGPRKSTRSGVVK